MQKFDLAMLRLIFYLVVSLLLFYYLTMAGRSFPKNTTGKVHKYCFLFLEADH